MADIESVVRFHLTLLRAAGAGAATQVKNDWLSNHIAGPEQGVPEGETSIARVIRKVVGLRDAGIVGVPLSLSNLEKLLVYGKGKDGVPRSFSTLIDVAMKNTPGSNNVALHGNVVRGLFTLTGKQWVADEDFREYAEVFRDYIDISIKGINFLKQKRQYLRTMGTAFDEYVRNSRRLSGLELDLICDRVTQTQAKSIVNEVHDSFIGYQNPDSTLDTRL